MIWLSVIGAVVGAWLALEALAFALVRWHRPFFPWLITPADSAPVIDEAVVAAHRDRSFDPDLGWCRRPGEHATEHTDDGDVTFRTDALARRANPGHEDTPATVACFGDSFTFCRLVDDDHTWPHHLTRLTGEVTANYGVGGYGLDQALLRLERELPRLGCRTVIMGVVPETMARVHSAWKHYFEYGNTLAFKPRFTLERDGSGLRHHPPAVTSPEGYRGYQAQLPAVQALDPFYRAKFRRDLLAFPYTPRLLARARRILPILAELTVFRAMRRPETAFRRAFATVLTENNRASNRLYHDSGATDLLRALVVRFADTCRDAGAQPLLVILPQPGDLRNDRTARTRARFFASLEEVLPVVDVTETFRTHPDPARLYAGGRLGPHASDAGNQLVAAAVAARLATLPTVAALSKEPR
ncbi:hypothetical protein DN069_06865 [Streptacidiphilus pinicola]|uniref:SGNH/GDSL hydrolase family protein n=1 Tax=Streptacidiphilus pinicola TaxID=2219663 RepID=A0A2X0IRW0_9ACTN|nr:SGNH/GDSL hydrolase family protein [Streptacidiphilus pinicola]RAG86343.1 hypothetical protein DN069_06865 [Streptacidiphilus pinicola]